VCYVNVPGPAFGFGPVAAAGVTNRSAGRFPDGADTGSNCTDFQTQAVANLAAAAVAGVSNIKVSNVEGFYPGQTLMVDTGASLETSVIAKVGTAGATTVDTPTNASAIVVSVSRAFGFRDGQTITIDDGANAETAVVASVNFRGVSTIKVTAPLTHAHAAGVQVSGTGITLTSALTKAHASGAQVSDNVPTPGTPNRYDTKRR
jgi:hypothetical protein